ncbi:M56 family metallopeptidase [Hymenobacter sediminis]|uniref:M56 family metallopeptidase n=1 Tax=Hymenobacter sediminis TaxID=2218621 RepID=UPI000DA6CF88|nr:M56 family metallopeptidase [Hymenobacter sediminis]RPD43978.1 M56 family metallopeptidase [Hymenobacter sediminis]
MSALNDLFTPALLRATGFTLLHSLWQGAIVAVVAAVLLLVLHRHRAAVRYGVLLGSLLLVVASATTTFVQYYGTVPAGYGNGQAATATGKTTAQLGAHQTLRVLDAELADYLQAGLAAGTTYAEQHLPLLVGAWLLGLLAMTLRLLAGLAYVRRLRRYRVAALPAAWQQRLDALGTQAGLTRRVQVLASALVPSPVVVGYVKPVILLPISALTGLAPRELELILAHEVAHVLRQDYLVNLLQTLVEVVFFYHPAVWFLSAALRTEREHCCDDLAAELCGDARTLAQALSSLAELAYAEARAPRLVLAAAGPAGKGALLGRVRRLVMRPPAAPAFWASGWTVSAVLLGVALLVGSTLTSLDAVAHAAPRTSTRQQAPQRKPVDLLEDAMKRDGLLPNPLTYEYTLRASSLVVNGQAQPAAVAARYRRLYESLSGESLWPVVSSLYRHVHDEDEAPATRPAGAATP